MISKRRSPCPSIDKEAFRAILKHKIDKEGWSLEQAASFLNIGRATLYNWLRYGRSPRRTAVVKNVCAKFNIPLVDVLKNMGTNKEDFTKEFMMSSAGLIKMHKRCMSNRDYMSTMVIPYICSWIKAFLEYRNIPCMFMCDLENNNVITIQFPGQKPIMSLTVTTNEQFMACVNLRDSLNSTLQTYTFGETNMWKLSRFIRGSKAFKQMKSSYGKNR